MTNEEGASVTEEGTETSETVTDESDSGKVKAADVQVLSGNPTDEEIAALVAALSALASKAETESLKPRNLWAEPIDMLRYSPHSWQRVTLFERAKLARPQGMF
ncbi:acyl-CoA carboxylase epsilon subunit [Mycobacteroides stephanolepidis]|uniref:acyl-CoA carboxylase epsilon subunit n=1 Tax=[Mycobacterium] stephanolepidis TaxID=1520670 RepID=UPI000BBACAEF|nr:acyl-CoA carboxylase epsilon subunit [[Mycobacterium] stephanolepidis]